MSIRTNWSRVDHADTDFCVSAGLPASTSDCAAPLKRQRLCLSEYEISLVVCSIPVNGQWRRSSQGGRLPHHLRAASAASVLRASQSTVTRDGEAEGLVNRMTTAGSLALAHSGGIAQSTRFIYDRLYDNGAPRVACDSP